MGRGGGHRHKSLLQSVSLIQGGSLHRALGDLDNEGANGDCAQGRAPVSNADGCLEVYDKLGHWQEPGKTKSVPAPTPIAKG